MSLTRQGSGLVTERNEIDETEFPVVFAEPSKPREDSQSGDSDWHVLDAKDFAEAKADPIPSELRFLTFNIACLPTILGQINKDFLRPNLERAEEIVQSLISSQDHTVDLQEIFDPAVRALVAKKSSPYFPYNSGVEDQRAPLLLTKSKFLALLETLQPAVREVIRELYAPHFHSGVGINDQVKLFRPVGSGLMTLSKFPIVAVEFNYFPLELPGEEALASKGYLATKHAVGNLYYANYNTHLPGGGAIAKDILDKLGLTPSFVRGKAMGEIHKHIAQVKWPQQPIKNRLDLKDSGVVMLSGDFNSKLNDEKSRDQISTGLSCNGYTEGEVKYEGNPQKLFSLFKFTKPENFIETRMIPPVIPTWLDKRKSKVKVEKVPKVYDYDKLREAREKGLFIGTTIPSKALKNFKEDKSAAPLGPADSEPKIIDAMFTNSDQEFTTTIVSMNTDKKIVSDHNAVRGRLKWRQEVSPLALPDSGLPKQSMFAKTDKMPEVEYVIDVDETGTCALRLGMGSKA